MATNENVLPGVGFVSETGTTNDNVLPGYGFILETQAAAGGGAVFPSRLGSPWHPGRTMMAAARFIQSRQYAKTPTAALTVLFRKTLSRIGSRTGSRQTHDN